MDAMKFVAGLPLEREYEAWVIRGIQMYLRSRKVRNVIAAVSPFDEKTWPADEIMAIGSDKKVIGLQFKRPSFTTNVASFETLGWPLNSPGGQFSSVQAHPNIYYALPAFFNRRLLDLALDHTIFWRPEPNTYYSTAWYNNPRTRSNPNVHMGMRWGKFIEDVLRCKIGEPGVSGREILRNYKSASTLSPDGVGMAIFDTERDQTIELNERIYEGADRSVLYLIQVDLSAKAQLRP